MAEAIQEPKGLRLEHLLFLDDLRESGVTNMFGATSYLIDEFPELEEKDGRAILTHWMKTFSERHKKVA